MKGYRELMALEAKRSAEIEEVVKPIREKYKPLIDEFYEKITEDYLIENGWKEDGRYYAMGENEYFFNKDKSTVFYNKQTNLIRTYYGIPQRTIINKQDLKDYEEAIISGDFTNLMPKG